MRRSGFARQPVAKQHNQASAIPSSHAFRVASAQPVGKETNCCERVSLYGVHQDGVLVSTLRYVKTTFVPLPDEVSDSAGALVECFAIGAHAVRRAEIKAEQNVLVVGAGPIGLATAAIAGLKGHMLLLLILTVNVASTLWIIWRLMPSIPHRKILLPRFVRPLEANWLA